MNYLTPLHPAVSLALVVSGHEGTGLHIRFWWVAMFNATTTHTGNGSAASNAMSSVEVERRAFYQYLKRTYFNGKACVFSALCDAQLTDGMHRFVICVCRCKSVYGHHTLSQSFC